MLFGDHLVYPFCQWLKCSFFSLSLQITGYFLGLVPKSSDGVVKLKDNLTNSEKWVSKTDMEGSPALKLDVSFSRPIIVMPHDTNSHE
jgi:vacuolar protein sorting-associated protein 13A/C